MVAALIRKALSCFQLKLGFKRLIAICAGLGVFAMPACTSLPYYWQAAQGQWQLQTSAKPVAQWLAAPSTPPALKTKLEATQKMRAFASDALDLPRNLSYTLYADLGRPAVLWNVFATPALSLKLSESCFPIAGCVQYKGFFNQTDAIAYAKTLTSQGLDVQVAPVPAYSTLGWFNDPLLNTFIHYPEEALAKLIFHELAHQQLYVKDDSVFNESFATAVEELGLERWQAANPNPASSAALLAWEARRADFKTLIARTHDDLKAAYALPDNAQQAAGKAAALADLNLRYAALKLSWGGFSGYDGWFKPPADGLPAVGNAHFAALEAYQRWVPAFKRMAAQHASFAQFYKAVGALAQKPKAERERLLQNLTPQPPL